MSYSNLFVHDMKQKIHLFIKVLHVRYNFYTRTKNILKIYVDILFTLHYNYLLHREIQNVNFVNITSWGKSIRNLEPKEP